MRQEELLHYRFRGGDTDLHASITHRVASILRKKIKQSILRGHGIRPLTVTLQLDKTSMYHVLAHHEYLQEISYLVKNILQEDDGLCIHIFHAREEIAWENGACTNKNNMARWCSLLSFLYKKTRGTRVVFFIDFL